MKNKLRYIVIGVITLIVLIIVGLFIYNTLNDKNKITVNEKKWINNVTRIRKRKIEKVLDLLK